MSKDYSKFGIHMPKVAEEPSKLLQDTRKRNWAIFRLRGLQASLQALRVTIYELEPMSTDAHPDWLNIRRNLDLASVKINIAANLLIELMPPKEKEPPSA